MVGVYPVAKRGNQTVARALQSTKGYDPQFMNAPRAHAALALAATLVAAAGPLVGAEDFEGTSRTEVETAIVSAARAYQGAPGEVEARRAYADLLFKLGRIWEANDVIASVATPWASEPADLALGARLALLTGDYDRARALYARLRDLADPGSEDHVAASGGLLMVAYQTNRFDDAADLEIPDDPDRKKGSLLTFMQRFEGEPYGLEWSTDERVARLPMLNDIAPPGALPMVEIEVNGQPIELILDTGGDRLFLDEAAAERIGVRALAERQARYAYTQGEYVTEPLGVVDSVRLDGATLANVPVIVAQWKRLVGDTRGDGVLPTQILKQFLTTIDYDRREIVLRERGPSGRRQLLDELGEDAHRIPFWLSGSHLMFAQGSLNGRDRLNFLIDSGLAASMPLIVINETAAYLAAEEIPIPDTPYFMIGLESHGLGEITRGATQALGNVLVEDAPYWRQGFFWDGLLSHQFLRHLGSWTIDFDTMSFHFPADVAADSPARPSSASASDSPTGRREAPESTTREKTEPTPAAPSPPPASAASSPLSDYVGVYEIVPGTDLVVREAEGRLTLQVARQNPVPMVPTGGDTFAVVLAGATLEFRRNESGEVTRLLLKQQGFETLATRKQLRPER